MPKKKKREIFVKPSYIKYPVEPLFKDTTDIEMVKDWEISVKMSRYVSKLMIVVGALGFIFSIMALAPTTILDMKFLLNSQFRTLIMFLLGLIGASNILCGLILLAKG